MLAQNPTTRPIGFSNRKMASVFNQVKIELSRAGLVQQQYEVHTKVRAAIDALDYEYNHDARTQSPRLSAARLQLAVGRRGLGPREQEEQRTQRASFVATYRSNKSTQSSSSSCWARMLSLEKTTMKRLGTSLCGQTRVSERRLGCLSPGPSEVHSARRRT